MTAAKSSKIFSIFASRIPFPSLGIVYHETIGKVDAFLLVGTLSSRFFRFLSAKLGKRKAFAVSAHSAPTTKPIIPFFSIHAKTKNRYFRK